VNPVEPVEKRLDIRAIHGKAVGLFSSSQTKMRPASRDQEYWNQGPGNISQ